MTKPVDHKQFYRTPWGMAFIAYLMAMGLVGALTPPDILTAYSWTRPFTDFMASLVSQIDKVTALGIDADINRFYFSVMWACSPILIMLFYVGGKKHKQYEYPWTSSSQDKKDIEHMAFFESLKYVAPMIALILISYHIDWFGGHRTRLTRLSLGTNLGRIFLPQVLVMGPTMFGYVVFRWALGWLSGGISKNIRSQIKKGNSHGK